ncbi:MAG TPA: hypothetical protein VIJ29_00105 [Candidatus Paceibacterota bacterium]
MDLRIFGFSSVAAIIVLAVACVVVHYRSTRSKEMRQQDRRWNKQLAQQKNVGGRIYNALKRLTQEELGDKDVRIERSYEGEGSMYSIVVFHPGSKSINFTFDQGVYSGYRILLVDVYIGSKHAIQPTYFYDPYVTGFPDHDHANDEEGVTEVIATMCDHIRSMCG